MEASFLKAQQLTHYIFFMYTLSLGWRSLMSWRQILMEEAAPKREDSEEEILAQRNSWAPGKPASLRNCEHWPSLTYPPDLLSRLDPCPGLTSSSQPHCVFLVLFLFPGMWFGGILPKCVFLCPKQTFGFSLILFFLRSSLPFHFVWEAIPRKRYSTDRTER